MTAPIYRDSKGRFVSLPAEARAKLEAMRGRRPIPTLTDAVSPSVYGLFAEPQHKGWLERAIHWFTWNRSRA